MHMCIVGYWRYAFRLISVTIESVVSFLVVVYTVVPTKSDGDVIFCLQLLNQTLTCTHHLS